MPPIRRVVLLSPECYEAYLAMGITHLGDERLGGVGDASAEFPAENCGSRHCLPLTRLGVGNSHAPDTAQAYVGNGRGNDLRRHELPGLGERAVGL